MEHVCSKTGTTMYRIQQIANIPVYYFMKCDLTNKCYENIQQAGFDKVELDIFEADELFRPTAIANFIYFFLFENARQWCCNEIDATCSLFKLKLMVYVFFGNKAKIMRYRYIKYLCDTFYL